jgi:hypothetical protein
MVEDVHIYSSIVYNRPMHNLNERIGKNKQDQSKRHNGCIHLHIRPKAFDSAL